MKISLEKAQELFNKYNLNPDVITPDVFHHALNVEAEHAKTVRRNIDTIAKIVLDHLKEGVNYYQEIAKVEKKLKKSNKNIFK